MNKEKLPELISKMRELQNDLIESNKKESALYFDRIRKKIVSSKLDLLKRVYIKRILKLGKLPDSVGFNKKQEDLFDEIFEIASDI
ncbi:MAG: hypothetical protein ACFFG0_47220 [Candidatus Thorarchaeota archaeon]